MELAVSTDLIRSRPTGRVLWMSWVSFSRFAPNVLHDDPVWLVVNIGKKRHLKSFVETNHSRMNLLTHVSK